MEQAEDFLAKWYIDKRRKGDAKVRDDCGQCESLDCQRIGVGGMGVVSFEISAADRNEPIDAQRSRGTPGEEYRWDDRL